MGDMWERDCALYEYADDTEGGTVNKTDETAAEPETGEIHPDLRDAAHSLLPAVVDSSAAVPALTLDEMAHALTLIEHFKRQIMRQGVDYGVIPGVKKPSLFKPGAERAETLFGFGHRMERVEVEREDGKRIGVTYRCVVFKPMPDGREVVKATCEGYAGNDESKWANAPWNTILKMADKRAYVGAILKATGMSDFFTQDVEDYSERITPQAAPAAPQAPSPDERFTGKAVAQIRAACADAGFSEDDIADMVEMGTEGRVSTLEEVTYGERPALAKAKAHIVERKAHGGDAAGAGFDSPAPPDQEDENDAYFAALAPRVQANVDPSVKTKVANPKKTRLILSLKALGIEEDEDQRRKLGLMLGHPVRSRSDLTVSEAKSVQAVLDEEGAG